VPAEPPPEQQRAGAIGGMSWAAPGRDAAVAAWRLHYMPPPCAKVPSVSERDSTSAGATGRRLHSSSLVAMARPTPLVLWIGAAFAIAEDQSRLWAAGHLHKSVHRVPGPYARTQNPSTSDGF
jgi:hypothetical protein